MGLDGFSMNNLGVHKELTSAQLANNAEALAQKGSIIKTVDNLSSKNKTKNKEFEEEEEIPVYFFEEDEKEKDRENNKNKKNNGDAKKYTVKLNSQTQLIELIDLEKEKIIETISPNDLIKLVSKLSSTSGILVNRRI